MSSYTPVSQPSYSQSLEPLPLQGSPWSTPRKRWIAFAAAAFLVSAPVFFQAPLVRVFPWLSLTLTLVWLAISMRLRSRFETYTWGDLLFGFTWTWLAGSIYWGWFRWEPMLHLPLEAIGLPFAAYYLSQQRGLVGNWFYLGSLLGTALTDVYFYLLNLIPLWRQLMQAEVENAPVIFATALQQMQSPLGVTCAMTIVSILFLVGILPLRSRQTHHWAFGGAVLSTLLVDGLFWLVASLT